MKLYKVWKNGRVINTPCPGRYAGITTMKFFGRLNCKSGTRAKKKNRIFFYFWEDAIEAGFRPCKNCKPEKVSRADCDHMPFGLTGGYALKLEPTYTKLKVKCALCEKFLGYAKKDTRGNFRWQDGLLVPLTSEALSASQ